MKRARLIDWLADAFAHEEGFYVTAEQAVALKIAFPTRAQRQCNPGNIRKWQREGAPYPRNGGYVDFLAWAGNREKALAEAWRVLRVLLGQYIDGQYHDGKKPNLYQICEKYAPAADANHPRRYAEHVAARIGTTADVVLATLIQEAV